MKRAEKLFIIHTADMMGGGSQSIRRLIGNLNEEVDLLVPKDGRVSNSALKRFYGKNVKKIYRFCLPFRQSTHGLKLKMEKEDVRKWVRREKGYLLDKKKIYKLIRMNHYRFVHLNSYILYPLLTSQFPMYIHIREVFEGGNLTRMIVHRKLRQAHGVIFIDPVVREAIGSCNQKELVLNNPFNQIGVMSVNKEEVYNNFHLPEGRTILAFVSACSNEIKGQNYVIEEFLRAGCTKSELLIVGSEASKEYKHVPGIHFLGRMENMEQIYAISDFVVRGDVMFATGRTTYEALYSGCSVMIPGKRASDKEKFFEYEKFCDRIQFYEPRKKDALADLIKSVDGKKKEKCLGLSNETEYVRQFLQFVEGGDRE
ncbi:MAG: glycosyltransferase [Lachnospiraceae bacterium]|nr:glycosyltransferase [Lachnospiraceae bacterium]